MAEIMDYKKTKNLALSDLLNGNMSNMTAIDTRHCFVNDVRNKFFVKGE